MEEYEKETMGKKSSTEGGEARTPNTAKTKGLKGPVSGSVERENFARVRKDLLRGLKN